MPTDIWDTFGGARLELRGTRSLAVRAGDQIAQALRSWCERADDRRHRSRGQPDLQDPDESADERVTETRRAAIDADDAAAHRPSPEA